MRDWLAEAAARHGDRPALKLASGEVWTWSELSQRAGDLAGRLTTAGVQPGARVAWLGASAGHGVPLLFALARLGAVFVPLNLRLTAGELRHQIGLADVRLLVCERHTETQTAQLAVDCSVCTLDAPQSADVRPLPTGAQLILADTASPPNAVQSVVFTSGTTGRPKGAQITFGNQQASAQASAERIGASADDRWLLTLPLYHVGGMAIPIRAAQSGACVVEYAAGRSFDPARLAETLSAERISHVSLVPTMLVRLLDAGFSGTPDLQVILLGGAAAPLDLLERAWARRLPIAPTYGLTEACSQVATLRSDDAPRKPGSVGQPLPGTVVTIQCEDGSEARAGEIGEVVVRGPAVFAGYLHAPNDRALHDGALHTGDLGYRDGDGDLFLVQRRTDLIVSGGENIYPAEVEAALRAHPSVAEACVVGLPHPDWGQQVAAAVVLQPGVQSDVTALDSWCRQRLAGYKRPRRYLIVPELPMTASGKVIRRAVVALFDGQPAP